MKRIGNLFDKIISLENLYLADEKARKGKSRSFGVRLHDKNRDSNLLSVHEKLKNQTYKTSKYHIFKIYEPKEREIYRLPYFPDRIIHHAIMNILEPIWVSILTKDTYSCLKNKGIHAAARSLKKELKSNKEETLYCLKLDIRKFYPSIDHSILKNIIRKRIKDKRLLWLLDEIIESVPSGVPIGNYLSQYFANVYLAYFDHWIKEEKKVKYYWRYADDIVILSQRKDHLNELLREIQVYMLDNLKLIVKSNHQVFPVESRGIDFLGYVFYHSYTLLRKSIKQKFFRRVAKLNKKEIPPTQAQYQQSICSWLGWCKHCDSVNLVNNILKKVPYEIKF